MLKAFTVVLSAANAKQIIIYADYKKTVKFKLKKNNNYKNSLDYLIIIVKGVSLMYFTFLYKTLNYFKNEIRLLNIKALKKIKLKSKLLVKCSL